MKIIKDARVFIAAALMAIVGCGEKEFFIVSEKAGALVENSPVLWNNAYVGKVTMSSGNILAIQFDGVYSDMIHAGVSAKIVDDTSISPRAFVLLVGGKDSSMPLLSGGSQIPEVLPEKPSNAIEAANRESGFKHVVRANSASVVDWLKDSSSDTSKVSGGVLLLLIAMTKFVKRLVRRIVKLLTWAVLAFLIFVTGSSWKNYSINVESAMSGAKDAAIWMENHSGDLQKILLK